MSRTTNDLRGVFFTDADTGTMVGQFGEILHTVTGGMVFVSAEPPGAELPHTLVLEQNDPNPFDPATTIGFTLPAAGYTTLVVYDLLGRSVATLVQGPLPAGRHEVAWQADGSPSGAYSYRLLAGPHASTRQLVVLR